MTTITFSSLSLSTAMITRDEMFSIGRKRFSMLGSYSEWHHTWTGFPIISCCGCTCGHFTTANTCLTDLSWCDADVEGIVNVWLMKYCIWAGRAEVVDWLAKGNMGVASTYGTWLALPSDAEGRWLPFILMEETFRAVLGIVKVSRLVLYSGYCIP